MAWKYVMMDVRMEKSGLHILFPIIFPDKLVHSDMAQAVSAVLKSHGLANHTVRSAGMIEQVAALGLGGKSETLNVESNAGDEKVIAMLPYFHGIET